MDLATNAFDGAMLAMHFVEPGIEAILHLGFNVTGHEVVSVEANNVLFLFNYFISNTMVVGVKYVQFRFEFTTEFLVPKEGSFEHAVESLHNF